MYINVISFGFYQFNTLITRLLFSLCIYLFIHLFILFSATITLQYFSMKIYISYLKKLITQYNWIIIQNNYKVISCRAFIKMRWSLFCSKKKMKIIFFNFIFVWKKYWTKKIEIEKINEHKKRNLCIFLVFYYIFFFTLFILKCALCC